MFFMFYVIYMIYDIDSVCLTEGGRKKRSFFIVPAIKMGGKGLSIKKKITFLKL